MFNIKNLFRVDPEYKKLSDKCINQAECIMVLTEKINNLDMENMRLKASLSSAKGATTKEHNKVLDLKGRLDAAESRIKELEADKYEAWRKLDKEEILRKIEPPLEYDGKWTCEDAINAVEQAYVCAENLELMCKGQAILTNEESKLRTGIVPAEAFVKLKEVKE
jgi:hypothetical protein